MQDRNLHTEGRLEWLCLALVITLAAHALPQWAMELSWRVLPNPAQAWVQDQVGWQNYYWLWTLAFGLLLALPSPVRSGLGIGKIQEYFWPTLLVCGLPVLGTALIYPQLPEHLRPFKGMEVGFWLISPLAQDLVFCGYLYGRFETLFPSYLHRRLPVRWAVVLAALYFAAWHLRNLEWSPVSFVMFQLCYTFAGAVFVGLSRQWTGSMWYLTLAHMAGNFIAWYWS